MSSRSRTSSDPRPPPALLRTAGTQVVVAATNRAILEKWTPGVVLKLAQGWAASGEHVVLADADLAAPVLHKLVGAEEGKGLGDVLVRGGTLAGLVVPVAGSSLSLIRAGSFPGDPFAVLDDDRWRRLTASSVGPGARLVVYVPAQEPWAAPILAWASDVIYLAAEDEVPESTIGHAGKVRAVLRRRVKDGAAVIRSEPPSAKKSTVDEKTPVARSEPEPPAPASDAGGEGPIHGAPAEPPGAGPAVTAPPLSGRRLARSGWRPTRGLTLAVAGVAVVGVAGALTGWFGLSSGGAEAGPEPAPATTSPPAEEAASSRAPVQGSPPAPVGPPPRYSVRLASFANRANALDLLADFSARAGDVWLGLAPVEVRGQVYHRLLAGLAPDSASALDLRRDLAATLGEDPGNWIVQRAALAFLISDVSTWDEAQRRAQELVDGGVPAYPLEVTLSDGSVRYHVYAGAFSDVAETGFLGELLERSGVSAELGERRGVAPAR